jgi:hypothetical protein
LGWGAVFGSLIDGGTQNSPLKAGVLYDKVYHIHSLIFMYSSSGLGFSPVFGKRRGERE